MLAVMASLLAELSGCIAVTSSITLVVGFRALPDRYFSKSSAMKP